MTTSVSLCASAGVESRVSGSTFHSNNSTAISIRRDMISTTTSRSISSNSRSGAHRGNVATPVCGWK